MPVGPGSTTITNESGVFVLAVKLTVAGALRMPRVPPSFTQKKKTLMVPVPNKMMVDKRKKKTTTLGGTFKAIPTSEW